MFITANEESYKDGQIIFKEGSYGDWIYLIEKGSVELAKTIDGRKIVLEVLHKGDIFGELGFITKEPRTATATAVGPCEVATIDNDFLVNEYNKLSGSFRIILNTIISRLNKVTELAAQKESVKTDMRPSKVLTVSYSSNEKGVKAFLENVGKNGLFIKTETPLPAGERFYLKLKMPNMQESMTIGCQVSWARKKTESPKKPAGMGAEFIKISKTDQELLNNTLDEANSL